MRDGSSDGTEGDSAEAGAPPAPDDWRSLVLMVFAPLTLRGLVVDPPPERSSPVDAVHFAAGSTRLRVGYDRVEGELLVQVSGERGPWRDLTEFLAPAAGRRLRLHRIPRSASKGMLAARLERVVDALAEAGPLPGLQPGPPPART